MLIQSEVDRGTKRTSESVTALILDSDDDGPIVSKKGLLTHQPLFLSVSVSLSVSLSLSLSIPLYLSLAHVSKQKLAQR
jgi:hypothetical protein